MDVSYTELFESIGVVGALEVYQTLLSEGRIILVSDNLHKLANCAHAAQGLLYPFIWQVRVDIIGHARINI